MRLSAFYMFMTLSLTTKVQNGNSSDNQNTQSPAIVKIKFGGDLQSNVNFEFNSKSVVSGAKKTITSTSHGPPTIISVDSEDILKDIELKLSQFKQNARHFQTFKFVENKEVETTIEKPTNLNNITVEEQSDAFDVWKFTQSFQEINAAENHTVILKKLAKLNSEYFSSDYNTPNSNYKLSRHQNQRQGKYLWGTSLTGFRNPYDAHLIIKLYPKGAQVLAAVTRAIYNRFQSNTDFTRNQAILNRVRGVNYIRRGYIRVRGRNRNRGNFRRTGINDPIRSGGGRNRGRNRLNRGNQGRVRNRGNRGNRNRGNRENRNRGNSSDRGISGNRGNQGNRGNNENLRNSANLNNLRNSVNNQRNPITEILNGNFQNNDGTGRLRNIEFVRNNSVTRTNTRITNQASQVIRGTGTTRNRKNPRLNQNQGVKNPTRNPNAGNPPKRSSTARPSTVGNIESDLFRGTSTASAANQVQNIQGNNPNRNPSTRKNRNRNRIPNTRGNGSRAEKTKVNDITSNTGILPVPGITRRIRRKNDGFKKQTSESPALSSEGVDSGGGGWRSTVRGLAPNNSIDGNLYTLNVKADAPFPVRGWATTHRPVSVSNARNTSILSNEAQVQLNDNVVKSSSGSNKNPFEKANVVWNWRNTVRRSGFSSALLSNAKLITNSVKLLDQDHTNLSENKFSEPYVEADPDYDIYKIRKEPSSDPSTGSGSGSGPGPSPPPENTHSTGWVRVSTVDGPGYDIQQFRWEGPRTSTIPKTIQKILPTPTASGSPITTLNNFLDITPALVHTVNSPSPLHTIRPVSIPIPTTTSETYDSISNVDLQNINTDSIGQEILKTIVDLGGGRGQAVQEETRQRVNDGMYTSFKNVGEVLMEYRTSLEIPDNSVSFSEEDSNFASDYVDFDTDITDQKPSVLVTVGTHDSQTSDITGGQYTAGFTSTNPIKLASEDCNMKMGNSDILGTDCDPVNAKYGLHFNAGGYRENEINSVTAKVDNGPSNGSGTTSTAPPSTTMRTVVDINNTNDLLRIRMRGQKPLAAINSTTSRPKNAAPSPEGAFQNALIGTNGFNEVPSDVYFISNDPFINEIGFNQGVNFNGGQRSYFCRGFYDPQDYECFEDGFCGCNEGGAFCGCYDDDFCGCFEPVGFFCGCYDDGFCGCYEPNNYCGCYEQDGFCGCCEPERGLFCGCYEGTDFCECIQDNGFCGLFNNGFYGDICFSTGVNIYSGPFVGYGLADSTRCYVRLLFRYIIRRRYELEIFFISERFRFSTWLYELHLAVVGVAFDLQSAKDSRKCFKSYLENKELCNWGDNGCLEEYQICKGRSPIVEVIHAHAQLIVSVVTIPAFFRAPDIVPFLALGQLTVQFVVNILQAKTAVKSFSKYFPLTTAEQWRHLTIYSVLLGLGIDERLLTQRAKAWRNGMAVDEMARFLKMESNSKKYFAYFGPAYDAEAETRTDRDSRKCRAIQRVEQTRNPFVRIGYYISFYFGRFLAFLNYLGKQFVIRFIIGKCETTTPYYDYSVISNNEIDLTSRKFRNYERWSPNPDEVIGNYKPTKFRSDNFICRPEGKKVVVGVPWLEGVGFECINALGYSSTNLPDLLNSNSNSGFGWGPALPLSAPGFDRTQRQFQIPNISIGFPGFSASYTQTARPTPIPPPVGDTRMAYIALGNGNDTAIGFEDFPNYFLVGGGDKDFTGGNKDDYFLLGGKGITSGILRGGDGIDTLEIGKDFPQGMADILMENGMQVLSSAAPAPAPVPPQPVVVTPKSSMVTAASPLVQILRPMLAVAPAPKRSTYILSRALGNSKLTNSSVASFKIRTDRPRKNSKQLTVLPPLISSLPSPRQLPNLPTVELPPIIAIPITPPTGGRPPDFGAPPPLMTSTEPADSGESPNPAPGPAPPMGGTPVQMGTATAGPTITVAKPPAIRPKLQLDSIETIIGREGVTERIASSCSNILIDGRGGSAFVPDILEIGMSHCRGYPLRNMMISVPAATVVTNYNRDRSANYFYDVMDETNESRISIKDQPEGSESEHSIFLETPVSKMSRINFGRNQDGIYFELGASTLDFSIDVHPSARANIRSLDEADFSIDSHTGGLFFTFNLANSVIPDIKGAENFRNVFRIHNRYDSITGGRRNDVFIFGENSQAAEIYGGERGVKTIVMGQDLRGSSTINMANRRIQTSGGTTTISSGSFENIVGRENVGDNLITGCDTKSVDLKNGGGNVNTILVPNNLRCASQPEMQIQVSPFTQVNNQNPGFGRFFYNVAQQPLTTRGDLRILEISESPNSFHYIQFEHEPQDFTSLTFDESAQEMHAIAHGDLDLRVHLPPFPKYPNASFIVNDHAEIVLGENLEENFGIGYGFGRSLGAINWREPIFRFRLTSLPNTRIFGGKFNSNHFHIQNKYTSVTGGGLGDVFIMGSDANVGLIDGGGGNDMLVFKNTLGPQPLALGTAHELALQASSSGTFRYVVPSTQGQYVVRLVAPRVARVDQFLANRMDEEPERFRLLFDLPASLFDVDSIVLNAHSSSIVLTFANDKEASFKVLQAPSNQQFLHRQNVKNDILEPFNFVTSDGYDIIAKKTGPGGILARKSIQEFELRKRLDTEVDTQRGILDVIESHMGIAKYLGIDILVTVSNFDGALLKKIQIESGEGAKPLINDPFIESHLVGRFSQGGDHLRGRGGAYFVITPTVNNVPVYIYVASPEPGPVPGSVPGHGPGVGPGHGYVHGPENGQGPVPGNGYGHGPVPSNGHGYGYGPQNFQNWAGRSNFAGTELESPLNVIDFSNFYHDRPKGVNPSDYSANFLIPKIEQKGPDLVITARYNFPKPQRGQIKPRIEEMDGGGGVPWVEQTVVLVNGAESYPLLSLKLYSTLYEFNRVHRYNPNNKNSINLVNMGFHKYGQGQIDWEIRPRFRNPNLNVHFKSTSRSRSKSKSKSKLKLKEKTKPKRRTEKIKSDNLLHQLQTLQLLSPKPNIVDSNQLGSLGNNILLVKQPVSSQSSAGNTSIGLLGAGGK